VAPHPVVEHLTLRTYGSDAPLLVHAQFAFASRVMILSTALAWARRRPA
jgi:hypothetical protein